MSKKTKITRKTPLVGAWYLPQYHPFSENDNWWGKGFTEWHHVVRSAPMFSGHEQPNLPSNLGFYDLRLKETQLQQVDLAKTYGIDFFAMYLYFFDGHQIMNEVVDRFCFDDELQFPIMFCWANENWSRRWDGSEQEVLISQSHEINQDKKIFEKYKKVFLSKRYVRINGKIPFIVYRSDIVPDAEKYFEQLRATASNILGEEIALIAVKSFGITEKEYEHIFDYFIDFPPHGVIGSEVVSSQIKLHQGAIYDYDEYRDKSLAKKDVHHKTFGGVMPRWDNTPRKGEHSNLWINHSPEKFRDILVSALDLQAQKPKSDEGIVFINSWNEWGETAHIEPDDRYGVAFLEAIRTAKVEFKRNQSVNRKTSKQSGPKTNRLIHQSARLSANTFVPLPQHLLPRSDLLKTRFNLEHCIQTSNNNQKTIQIKLWLLNSEKAPQSFFVGESEQGLFWKLNNASHWILRNDVPLMEAEQNDGLSPIGLNAYFELSGIAFSRLSLYIRQQKNYTVIPMAIKND